MQKRPRGKWSDPGVPHKGWHCVGDVEILDELATCEMCESAEIRYAHHMRHPDYQGELIVGCHCAEHMENDYRAPGIREAKLRDGCFAPTVAFTKVENFTAWQSVSENARGLSRSDLAKC